MAVFAGEVAVVTGASSGIGKAIALKLAANGARLCLLGRELESLRLVAGEVPTKGPAASSYQVDLTCDSEIYELTESISKKFGRVDILIHSAALFAMDRLETAPIEDLDRQYRVNVRAPYLLTQALLPELREHRGQVVFVNSSVGLRARAGVSQYAATKHALKAIADSLREEMSAEGVRVLTIYPGRTATRMQAAIYDVEGKQYRPDRLMQPEDVAGIVVNALSLPRTAEVVDISVLPSLAQSL